MGHCTTFNKHGFEASSQAASLAIIHDEAGQELGRIRGRVFDRLTGRTEYLVVEYGCGRQILLPWHLVKFSGSIQSTQLVHDDLDHLPAFHPAILSDDRQWRAYQQLHEMILRSTEARHHRAA